MIHANCDVMSQTAYLELATNSSSLNWLQGSFHENYTEDNIDPGTEIDQFQQASCFAFLDNLNNSRLFCSFDLFWTSTLPGAEPDWCSGQPGCRVWLAVRSQPWPYLHQRNLNL